MSLIVPFDGSELSKAALVRATQFNTAIEQGVVAVSIVPDNCASYARERGWIGPSDSYDGEVIVDDLRAAASDISPDAEFRHLFVDRNAGSRTIANTIRKFAREHDATIVFIGSDNAGQIARSLTVGSTVTSDQSYDTMIISSFGSTIADRLESSD